jgi:hypothetical protein
LTEANRVITIDLWWNNAREDQAFARVHHIGQTKPTYFVRIVSEGDKLITAMQDRKAKEVSYAMKEDGHKVKRLGRNAFNAIFEEDPNPTDDKESESGSDDEGADDAEIGAKRARSVQKEAHDVAEVQFAGPAVSKEEHGGEEHGREDQGMTGHDIEAQGAVQNGSKNEMPAILDNDNGSQSQVLLLRDS